MYLDDKSDRVSWRVVSPRAFLPIKIRMLPLHMVDSTVVSPIQSNIAATLFSSSTVGSSVLHLGSYVDHTPWFVIVSDEEHTRYFHMNAQSGELTLLRPIDEYMAKSTLVELQVQVTQNWIHTQTIRVGRRRRQEPPFHSCILISRSSFIL